MRASLILVTSRRPTLSAIDTSPAPASRVLNRGSRPSLLLLPPPMNQPLPGQGQLANMPDLHTAEQLYTDQFLRSLHSRSTPSPLTTAQAGKAAAKAWADAAANVRRKYEEMAHPEALQGQLAKKAKKSAPLPAFGQAGVLPDVFVVRWELSASITKLPDRMYEDCKACYESENERMDDLIRKHHEAKVGGSTKDAYSTVAAANAAATAQFDKFRRNELGDAKARHDSCSASCNVDDEDDEDDEDDGGAAKHEFTEFTQTLLVGGAACWRWNVIWAEQAVHSECSEVMVAHKGFVHVERMRVLAGN
ncbi:hypothetical protein FOA52_015788 [Chlamydomonas sp. UWO 241]|nr:hypothetical protein FOA52_015788 [Chlamydomonas sp. UWO 241]